MPLRRRHWFFRFRIYHLPFWFAYHTAWWTVLVGSPLIVWSSLNSPYGIKFIFYVLFEAIGVYFNFYVLIPRLLEKGRYLMYILAVIFVTIAVGVAIVPGYFLSSTLSGVPLEKLYGNGANTFWHFFQLNTFASSVASMTLAMSVKLAKNWLEARRRTSSLEKEKLETELKFLKSQLNPHFLFNTINSIFVLIPKNPALASSTLARFSDLLRYQLYDCNDEQIPLDQELIFIRNFIELESLRHDDNLAIKTSWPTDVAAFGIAPFILLPFIENAFKHVAHSRQQPGRIIITIELAAGRLHLSVKNTRDPQQQAVHVIAYGGIGLANVHRRLHLLYSERHVLSIKETATDYIIDLALSLTTLPSSLKLTSI